MAGKDFSKMNTAPVYGEISKATNGSQRKTYTEEEAATFMDELKTSGRKGVKLPRINMAFKPVLYDYIKTMSKMTGLTMTEFINQEMQKSYDENKDVYDQALALRKKMEGRERQV